MSRYWNNEGCSYISLVTARDWKDNSTYINNKDEGIFPEITGMCAEDPFLWLDCDGNYHAFFHNMDPLRYIGLDGSHAFSQDGITWTYGGYSWGDYVEFDDGSSMTIGSRERPHLLFDSKDGCTPIGLTNGIVYGYHDQSYTFLQPVKQ